MVNQSAPFHFSKSFSMVSIFCIISMLFDLHLYIQYSKQGYLFISTYCGPLETCEPYCSPSIPEAGGWQVGPFLMLRLAPGKGAVCLWVMHLQFLENYRMQPGDPSTVQKSSSKVDWPTLFGQCLFWTYLSRPKSVGDPAEDPFLARVTLAHRKWAGVAPPGQWNRCTMGCPKLHAIEMSSNLHS